MDSVGKANKRSSSDSQPGGFTMSSNDKIVLLFELGLQKYTLPFHVVDEILPAVELLPVPGSHSAMEGLLDVRGEILPVVALSALLNLESRPIRYTDHLIVLNLNTARFAVRVDRACELANLPEATDQNTKLPLCGALIARIDRYNGDRVTSLDPEGLSQMLTMNSQAENSSSSTSLALSKGN